MEGRTDRWRQSSSSWTRTQIPNPIAAANSRNDAYFIQLPHRISVDCRISANHLPHSRKIKAARAANTISLSDAKWKEVEPMLAELYARDGCQLRFVAEIMQYLYHFQSSHGIYKNQFQKRGIVNNTGARQSGRQRSRALPFKKTKSISGDIVNLKEFSFHPRGGDNLPLTRYRTQEKVLFNLDKYIAAMFDRRSQGWTTDMLDFVESNGQRSCQTRKLQFLPDVCYGASVLTKSSSRGKAEVSLNQFFHGLDQIAMSRDPSILVKFWRICLQLRTLDGFNPRCRVVKRFFTKLQLILSSYHGEDHPLCFLMGLFRHVSSEDFKDTLRIGYFKTITVLSKMIGEENAIVLHMWPVYFKYWDRQLLHKETFMKSFQALWDQTVDSENLRNFILVCYYYTYAAYYLCESPYLAEKMAGNLLKDMKPLDLNPE